jgi:hypothetical protein
MLLFFSFPTNFYEYIYLQDLLFKFHDLILNYNYLYKTLRAQSAFDIKKLENIKFQTKSTEAIRMIDEMISEKSSQISDPAVKLEQDHDSHHAS